MRIRARAQGEVMILDITGNIVRIRDSRANLLREQVAQCLAEGSRRVLINMETVEEIDSSGIGQLVQVLVSMRREGGQIKLLKASALVRRLLSITALQALFECHDDESAAVASF